MVKYARTDSSALAEHFWGLGHQVAFGGTSILAQESRLTQCLVLESWYIQRLDTINNEQGTSSTVYGCLR